MVLGQSVSPALKFNAERKIDILTQSAKEMLYV